jgi:hypothetical protein
VRGIEAYRDTWPPFFQWQASGAVFQIESLSVTAGTDVAFAYALLRCGAPADLARDPEQRLRLTLGLRKAGGRWIVVHEHHSFPYTAPSDTAPSDTAPSDTAPLDTTPSDTAPLDTTPSDTAPSSDAAAQS